MIPAVLTIIRQQSSWWWPSS